MRLWHFTSIFHLVAIVEAGSLRLTDSVIGSSRSDWPPTGDHAGPDVLWCFDTPDPDVGDPEMLIGHRYVPRRVFGRRVGRGKLHRIDKQLVRFTLDVPDSEVVAWVPWARAQGIDERWLEALTRNNPPDGWRCVLRPVPESEWVTVDTRPTLDAEWETCPGF